MHPTACVFVYLACTGFARRLHIASTPSQASATEGHKRFPWSLSANSKVHSRGPSRKVDPRRVLASLLLRTAPAAGWHIISSASRCGIAIPICSRASTGLVAESGQSSTPKLDSTVHDRRAVLAATAAAFATAPALPARAWCGTETPRWGFFLQWTEKPKVPFKYKGVRGTVFYREVGDLAREENAGVTPILIVGTPGLGYNYLENFEASTVCDRRVVEVTLAGSDTAVDPRLATIDACVEQLRVVLQTVNITRVHIVAHGLGAVPALRLISSTNEVFAAGLMSEDSIRPIIVRSLTLISPFGNVADLRPAVLKEISAAKNSVEVGYKLLPTPSKVARESCIAEAVAPVPSGGSLLPLLIGASPSDALGGAQLGKRLAECGEDLPVLLFTGGESDIVDSSSWTGLPETVQPIKYPDTGPLPFIDKDEEFVASLIDFLDVVENKTTNRKLEFTDAYSTFKELMRPK